MSAAKKICLLGDFMVGKTSLIRRYVLDEFSPEYKATLGVGIYKHQSVVPPGEVGQSVNLILWDVEGGEHRQKMLPTYVMGAAGAILVCDASRPETADILEDYATLFDQHAPGRPLVMVANKIDLLEDGQVPESIQARAKNLNTMLVATSAKTGDRVVDAFHQLSLRIQQIGI